MKNAPARELKYFVLINLCVFLLSGWQQSFDSIDLSSENLATPFNPKKGEDDSSVPPVIRYSLDQIEKSKLINPFMSTWNAALEVSCKTCTVSTESLRYKTCNEQNSYLEKSLIESRDKDSLLAEMLKAPIITKSIIKPACLRASMEARFGESSKVFRQCSIDGKMSRAFRPCISENYFKLINNSFELVSSCMMKQISQGSSADSQRLDVRAIYALINVESGFHVNAMSGTGAGGIGQFTGPAIKDVNKNELDAVRHELESNPQCARLSHEMLNQLEPIRPGSTLSCDRISLENGNPIKNMIYTYAYLKGVRRSFDKVIFNNANYNKKFQLSSSELDKIKRALMVWSHNTGPAGTWTPVKVLLNTIYRNKTVTSADQFISELQQYMHKFPASANTSEARRKETSHYFPAITETLNKIETNIGGGSCVNF